MVRRCDVPAEDTDGGDHDDGEGVDEYSGEYAGRAKRRKRGFRFNVGREEGRGGGDMWTVEGRVYYDDWGFEGGETRETPIVEALEEEDQVGKGVVNGEDYLRGQQHDNAVQGV